MHNKNMPAKGWSALGGKKLISFFTALSVLFALVPAAFSQTTTTSITNVQVDGLTDTSAKITWNTDHPASTSLVYYSTDAGLITNTSISEDICSGGGAIDVTTHCVKLSGLSASTTYYYIAEVYTDSATYITSAEHSFVTLPADESGGSDALSPPSNLQAIVSTGGTDVVLSWEDNSTGEDYFELYRKDDTGQWLMLATIGINIKSYTDSVAVGGFYEYKIKACNSTGCSSFSNIATAVIDTVEEDSSSTNETTDEEPTTEEIIEETTEEEIIEEAATVETAAVSGVVKDPFGSPLAGVLVKLFNEEHTFAKGVTTDSAGAYSIDGVPPGIYYIKTYVPQTLGYISAPLREISFASGDIKTVDFQLRGSEQVLTGKIYIDGNVAGGAFVWAWSDEGGYRETKSASDGSFSLSVTSGMWHLSAAKEFDGALFKQRDVLVDTSTTLVRDLNLEREFNLNTTTKEQAISAEEEIIIKHDDGVEVTAAEGTFAESGTVTLSISADVETPSQEKTRRTVGVAYNIKARDAAGTFITTFSKPVRIRVPYKEGEVAKAGGNEDNLKLNFWDETASTWTEIDSSTIDKVNNFVSADVDHFTRFAVLTVVPQVDVGGIVDGDLIKTADNPDVYIVKFVGPKKYKRLVLNPDIFNSYGHLKWENIKTVTQGQVDAFFLSELTMEVYADGTPVNGHVYRVTSPPNSDVGISHRMDITAGQFEQKGFDWEGIFKINHFEASPDFYPAGAPITA